MKRTDDGAQDYLELYKGNGITFLTERNTLIESYRSSIKQLTATNPTAAELVKYCAYLHSESIKKSFLRQLLGVDDVRMNECIRDIRHYSLLSKDDRGFNMHPLAQAAIRHNEKIDGVFVKRLKPIADALLLTLKTQIDPVKARELQPHLQTIFGHLQTFIGVKSVVMAGEEACRCRDKVQAAIAEEREDKAEPAQPVAAHLIERSSNQVFAPSGSLFSQAAQNEADTPINRHLGSGRRPSGDFFPEAARGVSPSSLNMLPIEKISEEAEKASAQAVTQ
jgi:hypothetical protein